MKLINTCSFCFSYGRPYYCVEYMGNANFTIRQFKWLNLCKYINGFLVVLFVRVDRLSHIILLSLEREKTTHSDIRPTFFVRKFLFNPFLLNHWFLYNSFLNSKLEKMFSMLKKKFKDGILKFLHRYLYFSSLWV